MAPLAVAAMVVLAAATVSVGVADRTDEGLLNEQQEVQLFEGAADAADTTGVASGDTAPAPRQADTTRSSQEQSA